MLDRRLYLGIDLGGTKTALSVWRAGEGSDQNLTSPLTCLARHRWPTLSGGSSVNLERIVVEGQKILSDVVTKTDGKLIAVGISGGGPVDAASGTILSIPNLDGWCDVPVTQLVSEAFGVPAHIENDAKASALAEWTYGAGRGSENLAFLTCSTGIGAGLIVDGRLLHGHTNLAGEIGHLEIVPDGLPCGCGRRGCLEAYASGSGIAQRLNLLRASTPELPLTAREVVQRARTGDELCRDFLRETAEFLACGISHLVFCLNPERIILGTIAVGAGDLLLGPLRESVANRVWPSLGKELQILAAGLGRELGDYAALAVARQDVRRA